ncbi:MAG: class I SAM-dependent methyltransferase [Planctomycetota bacterium]|nr:class I SAM-dependent methyltransferase [Planctomycetota bacterium]
MKSSVEEIRRRFDADVERFSNLQTGQSSTIDAPLSLKLVVECAAAISPGAKSVLDVGCGAGNYTLALLQRLPGLRSTLLDLSQPMLERARQRVAAAGATQVETIQGDVREVDLGEGRHDVILAAAVLHHLRTEAEWRVVARKLFASLNPGGALFVSDLVDSAIPGVKAVMWNRYGQYLASLKDAAYRDHVFAYVEREDSPWPVTFQFDTLRAAGFAAVDVLHKNACFATYVAVKAAS